MAELSPAAQAVLDAAEKELDYVPIRHIQWVAAAALKALADQWKPEDMPEMHSCCHELIESIHTEIRAIATELEGNRG